MPGTTLSIDFLLMIGGFHALTPPMTLCKIFKTQKIFLSMTDNMNIYFVRRGYMLPILYLSLLLNSVICIFPFILLRWITYTCSEVCL